MGSAGIMSALPIFLQPEISFFCLSLYRRLRFRCNSDKFIPDAFFATFGKDKQVQRL